MAPANWDRATILDVSEQIRGVTYSKSDASDEPKEGYLPILRANNIQDDKLRFVDLVYVPESCVSQSQLLRSNDVVVAMSSGSASVVGKAAQTRQAWNGAFGAFCGVLRPSPIMEARYFGHFLRSEEYRSKVSALSKGININNLKREHFQQIEIPVAPLNEQKRIADKLDQTLAIVERAKARLARAPEILKQFRQSVLAAATDGRLTEDWREVMGNTGEWAASEVQAVAKVGTGSTPLRSNDSFYSATGTPWITSAATAKPFVNVAEEFVTDVAITAHRLKIWPVGTLLVAMYGEGKTRGQVTELGIAATINQACAAIVVDQEKALSSFVKLSLQANYMTMRELAEGGNQPNLNLSKIKEFPLRLPSVEEQHEIVRRVETLFALADRIEARYQAISEKVDKLTQSLLAKAFRGELVPQDPNDEPASELLARIAATRASPSTSRTNRNPRIHKSVRATKEAATMTKSRQDEEVKDKPYLAGRLRLLGGSAVVETLFKSSELPIADFYKQLAWEVEHGYVRDAGAVLEACDEA